MPMNEFARISKAHWNLIKQLSADEQGKIIIALMNYVFANSKNQNEIQFEKKSKNQIDIQIDFLSESAKAVFYAILPAMKLRTNRAGGARPGAGRPRKSGNVPKMHISENIGKLAEPKNQIENQIEFENTKSKNQNEIQFEFETAKKTSKKIQIENQIEKNQPNARARDNNKNIINNNIIPLKENIALSGNVKENPPLPKNWALALAEWNRIAGLYHRPRMRNIPPALQKAISARCKENKLHLGEFMAICEQALARDKNMRCGTDNWRGADLLFFSRCANFTRALQIVDNPQESKGASNATADVLREFIKGE